MKKWLVCLSLVVALLGLAGPVPVKAAPPNCADDPFAKGCPCNIAPDSLACSGFDNKNNPNPDGNSETRLNSTIRNFINASLMVIAIVVIIMIIVGGYQFTTSHGKPEQVTKARLIITYSVVGLVVAILAYAIVYWIIGAL
jgi:magnesium-transporting ATPase (P-type)